MAAFNRAGTLSDTYIKVRVIPNDQGGITFSDGVNRWITFETESIICNLLFYSRVVCSAHPIVFHSNNLESAPKVLGSRRRRSMYEAFPSCQ